MAERVINSRGFANIRVLNSGSRSGIEAHIDDLLAVDENAEPMPLILAFNSHRYYYKGFPIRVWTDPLTSKTRYDTAFKKEYSHDRL